MKLFKRKPKELTPEQKEQIGWKTAQRLLKL